MSILASTFFGCAFRFLFKVGQLAYALKQEGGAVSSVQIDLQKDQPGSLRQCVAVFESHKASARIGTVLR